MAKRPLKILGLTQGQNIELLDKLLKAMIREDKLEVEKAAVLVSYAATFSHHPPGMPPFRVPNSSRNGKS